MKIRLLVYGAGQLHPIDLPIADQSELPPLISVQVQQPQRALEDGLSPGHATPQPIAQFKRYRCFNGHADYLLITRPPMGKRWIVAAGRLLEEDKILA